MSSSVRRELSPRDKIVPACRETHFSIRLPLHSDIERASLSPSVKGTRAVCVSACNRIPEEEKESRRRRRLLCKTPVLPGLVPGNQKSVPARSSRQSRLDWKALNDTGILDYRIGFVSDSELPGAGIIILGHKLRSLSLRLLSAPLRSHSSDIQDPRVEILDANRRGSRVLWIAGTFDSGKLRIDELLASLRRSALAFIPPPPRCV